MEQVKRFSLDMQFAKSQVKHDSEGELCFYRDYVALQQKLGAVLAENVALKAAIKDAHKCAEECEFNGEFCYVMPSCELEALGDCLDETPATDAILNEVRAEGADAAAAKIRKSIPAFKDAHSGAVIECADIAEMVADQLRAGNFEGVSQ